MDYHPQDSGRFYVMIIYRIIFTKETMGFIKRIFGKSSGNHSDDIVKEMVFTYVRYQDKELHNSFPYLTDKEYIKLQNNLVEEIEGMTPSPRSIELLNFLKDCHPVMFDGVITATYRKLAEFDRDGKGTPTANGKQPDAIDHLIRSLNSADDNVRWKAISSLGDSRDPRAVEPLIKLLNDPLNPIRHEAVKALGKIGDSRAIDPLITKMGPDSAITEICASVLSGFDDPRVVESMLKLKDSHVPYYREAAARAFGKIRDPRAFQALLELLDDNEMVRMASIEALGDTNDPQATGLLLELLNDPSDDIRREAVMALGKIGDPRAIEPLINKLNSDDKVRRACAWSLRRFDDPRIVEPFLKLIDDPDPSVRRSAADAYGKIQDPRSFDALLKLLDDRDHDVRVDAIKALGGKNDPRATEPLRRKLNDADYSVRTTAAEVLGIPPR